MRSFILSQWRDLRIGVVWVNFGALTGRTASGQTVLKRGLSTLCTFPWKFTLISTFLEDEAVWPDAVRQVKLLHPLKNVLISVNFQGKVHNAERRLFINTETTRPTAQRHHAITVVTITTHHMHLVRVNTINSRQNERNQPINHKPAVCHLSFRSTNVLWIKNWRTLLHMRLADAACALICFSITQWL